MMNELKIEFRSDGYRPRVTEVLLELPGGTDAAVTWDESTQACRGSGPVTQLCFGLRAGAGAGRTAPSWEELTRARLLDVKWEADNDVCPGRLEDVKLWAVDDQRNIQVPIDQYSAAFPCGIPWPGIDRGARPMVRYFNNNGLRTSASCSGHPGTSRKRFWIDFAPGVADADIARFMGAHAQDGSRAFMANGMFCARYSQVTDPGGGLSKTLQYTAPDLLDAMMDLNDWVADGMSGTPGHGGMDPVPWDRDRSAARIATANMDPAVADALYRAVWKDRVLEDIRSWLEEHDEELTQEQAGYAADRYVYDGKYDCNLSYWSNIENVVQLAREFA